MKKLFYIGIIILIIAAICIFAFSSDNNKEKNIIKNETNINESSENKEEIANQINEVVEDEVINEITNEETTNETENNVSTETFKESPKTAEEKAVEIVKKDWEGNNANFSVEGMDGNGNYIVAVRDSSTVALAFYSVNVTDGTFTKREMN